MEDVAGKVLNLLHNDHTSSGVPNLLFKG